MAKKDDLNEKIGTETLTQTANAEQVVKTKKYLYTGFSCAFTFGKEEKLLTNNVIYTLPSNDETTKKLVRRGKLNEIKEKN